jgi:hypothetical protein
MAKVNIGLRQAKMLCQLPKKERINLIGEGLPIIFKSARGFWRASGQLADNNLREGDADRKAACLGPTMIGQRRREYGQKRSQ